MGATTHNFKNTIVIIDGVIITGFTDGDAISTSKNEDDVTAHVGAGGDVTFNESNDPTGTVTITLKQDSSSVPILDALHKSKKMFSVEVNDTGNGKRISGSECRFSKTPDASWGNEVTGREYTILVADFKED